MPGFRADTVPRQVCADLGPRYVLAVAGIDPEDDHLARLLQKGQRVGECALRLAGSVPGEHDGLRIGAEGAGIGPDQHRPARGEHRAVRQPGDAVFVVGVGLADDGDIGVVRARRDPIDRVARQQAPFGRHCRLRRPLGELPLGLFGQRSLFRIQPLVDLRGELEAREAGDDETRQHVDTGNPAFVSFSQLDRCLKPHLRAIILSQMHDDILVRHGQASFTSPART